VSAAPELLVRSAAPPSSEGLLVRVTPESAGWRYVGFECFRISGGARLERLEPDRECCLVVLTGSATVQAGDSRWDHVGERPTVFDGPPHAVHLPAGHLLRVEARQGPVELALGWAPGQPTSLAQPVLIAPGDCRLTTRGQGVTERTIRDVLMEDRAADSLLVTEVVTPAGHWSSYPPHKHDTDDPPRETYLEETYYHRLRDRQGSAVQLVYTDDRSLDEALQVRDGDVVLVPRGYHPVVALPDHDLYYLNVMAGPRRQWRTTVDPRFSEQ